MIFQPYKTAWFGDSSFGIYLFHFIKQGGVIKSVLCFVRFIHHQKQHNYKEAHIHKRS